MNRVSGKCGPVPHQTVRLRQEGRDLAADELVADGFMAVGVDFIRVRNIPRPTARPVIIGHRLLRRRVLRLVRIKRIAVLVLLAPDRGVRSVRIDLENRVEGPVDIRIDAHTEEMLVVVGIDAGVDFRAPFFGVLTGVHGVGVEYSGEFDLELDGAVLVEDPVDAVFVVCGSEDMRDDELSPAGDDDGVIAEVGVLEEDPGIFLVDADGVLDDLGGARAVDEGGIHVVDGPFTIAAESEAVGHIPATVFAEVEGMFAVMGVFRVTVGDDHLCE